MNDPRIKRYRLSFALLALLLVLLLALNAGIGSTALGRAELWRALLHREEGGMAARILWGIRLPRLLAAALLGGALAVAGYLLQTFFSNPIAGPFVLGISSGAKLLVALTMIGCLSRGLVMRACAEQGIEVMVLDRPNPLGGNKVEGCLVEDGFHSFVSEFKIPYIYGITVGELAIMLNEEGLNCGEKGDEPPLKCKLSVIPMAGWHRNMLYSDTGLPWILPSPNIPYSESAIGYPSAGICGEFNNYLNIGIGYTLPFGVFAAEWIEADALKARLDGYGIPGIAFRTIHFKPFSGSAKGKLLHGVQYHYTDFDAATCTLTQFYVMQAVKELYPGHDPFKDSKGRLAMFDKVCGTDYVRTHFEKRFRVEDIRDYWNKDSESFKKRSQKYYLYE